MGINTQKNFEATLKYIKGKEYNRVVLGGDLCNKMGESFIYAYVKEKMEELGLPYFYIAGNHDDSQLLANVMGHTDRLVGDELYFINNTPQPSAVLPKTIDLDDEDFEDIEEIDNDDNGDI